MEKRRRRPTLLPMSPIPERSDDAESPAAESDEADSQTVNTRKWYSLRSFSYALYIILVVALSPIVLPYKAARTVGKLLAKRFDDLKSVPFFALFCFVEFAVIAFAVKQDRVVWYTLASFLSLFTLSAFANKEDSRVVLLSALAAELVVEVYEFSTFVQLVATLGIAIAAVIYIARHEIATPPVSLEHVFAWVCVRLLRGLNGFTSPEAKWRASQAILAFMIGVHIMRKFVRRRPAQNTLAHSVIYQAGAMLESSVGTVLLLMVCMLYATPHVLPRGINIWGLVVPLAFVLFTLLPSEKRYRVNEQPKEDTLRGVEALVAFAVIGVIVVTYSYPRVSVAASIAVDPCNTALTNMFSCTGPANVYVSGECCMHITHMIIPSKTVQRAVPIEHCQATILGPGSLDCCRQARKVAMEPLMSGKLGCICNANENGNAISSSGTSCACGAGFTGDACEIKT
jgi:hypothetical protein